ncbi:ATP-binding protein [Cellulomonas fengjieae]|uniref:AAA family ATPase n=1 Tax=Cellulomonas fengjieae TaxID=2819978 RepID=A0ABS3SDJ2_9CELL|nr:ATP-binding protein [Cellulomonas fengjieae]MBO3083030.1 AAA family ATPase [Cellulomonas fengjieae]QVI65599.1 AAA family ATPase [Cellulomonas fengjieae]
MTNRWAEWLRRNGTTRFDMARKAGWDAFVNAAPREPLERLDRRQIAALDEEELEDYNEARIVWNANLPTVQTPQLLAAYAVFEQVLASGRRDGDRQRGSVVVSADAGRGKSTTAQQFGRDLHRRICRREGALTAEGHQRWPVAFIPLSAGMTLKGLNQKILEFYGHPAAARSSTSSLGSFAVDCVLSCQTRLIVLDELHFIDFRHRHGIEVSNHLKWLANEMPVTFMYVGINLAERGFFDDGLAGEQAIYAQTSRRATRCTLSAFSLDSDASHAMWIKTLRALEGGIVLAEARPGMLTDHAREIFRRTQGNIGSLTNLIDGACLLAITKGAETIDADILAAVVMDNAATRSAAR